MKNKAALGARAVAAMFGGKALTGSKKQKEWGEVIRAEKISSMNEEQALLACDPNGLGRGAHFWIENRSRSGADIGCFFETQKDLLAKARSLKDAGDSSGYALTAKQYNALTECWGFKDGN